MPEANDGFLGIVLDSLASGVLAIDREGTIVVFNEAAARLLGVPKSEALGRHLLSIVPNSGLMNVLRTGSPEAGRPQAIGSRTVLTNRSPIMSGGALVGAVSIFQDITEMEKISRELDSTKIEEELTSLRGARYTFDSIEGSGPAIAAAKEEALRASRTDSTVLLRGQTGTGKELFAHAIHAAGRRGPTTARSTSISSD